MYEMPCLAYCHTGDLNTLLAARRMRRPALRSMLLLGVATLGGHPRLAPRPRRRPGALLGAGLGACCCLLHLLDGHWSLPCCAGLGSSCLLCLLLLLLCRQELAECKHWLLLLLLLCWSA